VTETEREVRRAAARFADGEATIQEMWSALHGNLHGLCASGPLRGDFLALFNALDRWESSVGRSRDLAVDAARDIAAQCGRGV
jgi:hypothetical protein